MKLAEMKFFLGDFIFRIPIASFAMQHYKGYREIPNPNNKKCNQDVKWCTISHHEQEKCKWLAQASINRAIQPSLECVPSTSKFSCLEDIKAGKADVVTSGAHYGYIARKKNLAPLAYPDTGMRYYIKPIVVIKTSNELNIQKFENLKNRKACLPEYAGIEWLSFINVVRDHKLFPNVTCDYGKLISDFVGDSCMPGAHDSEHEKSNQTNEDKLCGLCIPDINKSKTAKTCNADDTNKYYGDEGALKCLKEVGDFAVITKQVYKGINASEFKVLCKNGSLALTPGFDVDDNCVLTNIIDSEVVAKRNTTKFEDIAIVLFNFETRFGIDKAFQVFAEFNNTLNLLFKDSTFGLTTTNEVKPAVKNYNELFAHTDSCVENSPGAAAGVTVIPALITFASMFLILREF